MFGMGFMEIFLVLIVAVIALGPEKLPTALVDMAKFFKKIKTEINDAKTTINNELDISSMKEEAEQLKASISNVKSFVDIDINDLTSIEDDTPAKEIKKIEKVAEVKKKKIKNSTKQNISMYSNSENA